METIRKYGRKPYRAYLLHGGPGASGELKPVALKLSELFGVVECLQTQNTIDGQITELYSQIVENSSNPVTIIGYSWGAWLGYLFAGKYPDMVEKLILLSAAPFEREYSDQIMKTRMERLNQYQRTEAESLLLKIQSGQFSHETLFWFGTLIEIADSYEIVMDSDDSIEIDLEIFKQVWKEAEELRNSDALINYGKKIKSPVVAIHGDYDPHPVEGVEKPLKKILGNLKIILLKKCGHRPWKEKYAKEEFFMAVINEL